jgi:serine/threonine protein kinase
MICISKLNHENLVNLYGITISPLQMVLDYVPEGDLYSVLRSHKDLSMKWKLKVAIDCAIGMKYVTLLYYISTKLTLPLALPSLSSPSSLLLCRYLHSQSPPICHNDLRAPNILVCFLVISKHIFFSALLFFVLFFVFCVFCFLSFV